MTSHFWEPNDVPLCWNIKKVIREFLLGLPVVFLTGEKKKTKKILNLLLLVISFRSSLESHSRQLLLLLLCYHVNLLCLGCQLLTRNGGFYFYFVQSLSRVKILNSFYFPSRRHVLPAKRKLRMLILFFFFLFFSQRCIKHKKTFDQKKSILSICRFDHILE